MQQKHHIRRIWVFGMKGLCLLHIASYGDEMEGKGFDDDEILFSL